MNDDRAEMQERRQHGLKARQERRLENATYTAAEVKVLTEAASKFAYALGRKKAGEEIEAACEADAFYDVAARYHFARIARSIARQPPQDATSGRTDPEET